MRTKLLCVIAAVLLVLAGLCGCSRQETPAVPRNTIRRLSEADRVSIKSYGPGGAVTMPLSAEEAKKVIQAISVARKDTRYLAAAVELDIAFFKGTNLLADVPSTAGAGTFGIDGVIYMDETGTLKALSAKFREQAMTNSVR